MPKGVFTPLFGLFFFLKKNQLREFFHAKIEGDYSIESFFEKQSC